MLQTRHCGSRISCKKFWKLQVNEQFLDFPLSVYVDNQGAISLAKNHVHSEQIKYIELRYFFLHEKVEEKLLTFTYVPSGSNVADMFTKNVQRNNKKFNIGLREI